MIQLQKSQTQPAQQLHERTLQTRRAVQADWLKDDLADQLKFIIQFVSVIGHFISECARFLCCLFLFIGLDQIFFTLPNKKIKFNNFVQKHAKTDKNWQTDESAWFSRQLNTDKLISL